MDDIYSLFMADDEGTAQERAAALAAALRGKRALGLVGAASQNDLIAPAGRALLQDAGQGEGMLAQAGGQRSGQRLQRTLQAQAQDFQGKQAGAERAARASEGGLNRALERELAGLRAAAEAERAKREAALRGQEVGTGLRKELQGMPQAKAFYDVEVSHEKIKRAAANPSPAGDMALVFSYMRLLDPGTGVKEGEYANATNAASIPERIRAQYNRAKDGELLTPEMRNDFLGHAERLYGAHREQFGSLAKRYRGLAEQAGVDPSQVALDLGAEPTTGAQAAAPAAPGGGGSSAPDFMQVGTQRYRRQPDGTYLPE
jgi:hypothetical protein